VLLKPRIKKIDISVMVENKENHSQRVSTGNAAADAPVVLLLAIMAPTRPLPWLLRLTPQRYLATSILNGADDSSAPQMAVMS